MTLEERVAWLEQFADKLIALLDVNQGNITTPGNINQVGPRDPSNPIKQFMGPSMDAGLYTFMQERFPGQGTSLWAGLETFQRPDDDPAHAAWGYGALPLRLWGLTFLLEGNGDNVVRNIVAEKFYLQTPAHRNLQTGAFEKAHHYDAQGVPYTAAGMQLGGIYFDQADLGVYLTREGDSVVLYNQGQRKELA